MDKSKEANDDFMAELTQTTERIIAEAGEKAGREAEQELQQILGEYERKTKQIILKIKEETKTKTAEIANKMSEAIMLRIEQASAMAVTSKVSELSTRAGEITRKMQETAEKETHQNTNKAPTRLRENNESSAESESPEDLATVEKGDSGRKAEPAEPVVQEGEIKLQQSIETEDFDQWLTH